MMYDDKLVIVEMDTMTTYGFAEKGETADEAIQRANQYYTNDLKHLKASLQESKDEKRKQFLQSRIRENEVKIQAGFQVMETDKFQKIERERILSGKLNRVTEQEYEDALNVLPPLRCFVCLKCIQIHIQHSMHTTIEQANIIVKWLTVKIQVHGYIHCFVSADCNVSVIHKQKYGGKIDE